MALSAPSGLEASVGYATADGTAKAGTDYLPASGTLVFSPGITARKVTVTIVGDETAEPSESFRVDLSEPRNAALADGEAVVTIVDEDTMAKAEITSPPSGSYLSSSTVTFTWTGGAGALSTGSPWARRPGGRRSTTRARVPTSRGRCPGCRRTAAPSTRVYGRCSGPSGRSSTPRTWRPGAPSLSIIDVTVTEGHAGTTSATFTVTLAPASGATVTVGYATSDGTATAGSDYTAASGTLTFAPQQATQTITVPVQGDGAIEPNETFTVTLSVPTNARIGAGAGKPWGRSSTTTRRWPSPAPARGR